MGEFLTKDRIRNSILFAGIGLVAYAGLKRKNQFATNPVENGNYELPKPEASFEEKLISVNTKVSDPLDRSTKLKDTEGNELHSAIVPGLALVFSRTSGEMAEITESKTLRSVRIVDCVEVDGKIKTISREDAGKTDIGYEVYWKVSEEGSEPVDQSFNSRGFDHEKVMDRLNNLVNVPDLELLSMDEMLVRRGH